MAVVIVGAGAAGLTVAEALRHHGHRGPVTIVGDEPDLPYDRPPLSKQVLAGAWTDDRAQLMPEQRLAALDATLLLGRRVERVDTSARRVFLDDGAHLDYDDLVVATGVRPRTIRSNGLANVHTLRTLADAVALRPLLVPGARLLVVGGGFLGLETAATARGLGVDVTVVEPVPHPLSAQLGPTVARMLLDRHRAEGVDVRTGLQVGALLGNDGQTQSVRAVRGAVLSDGSEVEADVVLVAIGCTPGLDWLDTGENGSDLVVDDGLVCDQHCRAGDHVWAVGDVARWYHPGLGRHLRLEHRSHASDSAQVVARNILGEQVAYAPVPFFWTDHFDVKIQVTGTVPAGADIELVEGPDDRGRFVGRFCDGPATAAYLAWNFPGRFAAYRRQLLSPAA